MKKITRILMTVAVGFVLTACGVSQSSVKTAEEMAQFNEKIEAGNFIFQTSHVIPTGRFQPRLLSSVYEVKVRNDTVYSYLPYFGTAYTAQIGSNESPLIFESTQFKYSVSEGKKPGSNKEVKIEFSDTPYPVVYYFTFWDTGKADLRVSDMSRAPISFHGEIKE